MKSLRTAFAVCLLIGCREISKTDCGASFKQGPIVVNDPKTGTMNYLLVQGFDTRTTSCWKSMREQAQELANKVPTGHSLTVHFLDTTAFTFPKGGGVYGSEAVQRRVIALHHRGSNGDDIFVADPNGSGYYTEPGKQNIAVPPMKL